MASSNGQGAARRIPAGALATFPAGTVFYTRHGKWVKDADRLWDWHQRYVNPPYGFCNEGDGPLTSGAVSRYKLSERDIWATEATHE